MVPGDVCVFLLYLGATAGFARALAACEHGLLSESGQDVMDRHVIHSMVGFPLLTCFPVCAHARGRQLELGSPFLSFAFSLAFWA